MAESTKQSEREAGRSPSAWERETLAELAGAGLTEQRRARRWNIFFKFLAFAYLFFLLFMMIDVDLGEAHLDGKQAALVSLEGVIAGDAQASAENVIAGLRAAFGDANTAGVILRINSPGGSPVQAGYINDEIQRLRDEHPDIPLYAVAADVCASGGMYVAVAADKIYANEASIVGSIGVRMDSFGFVEAMDKLGIERRLLTAGQNKGLLDPFLPVKPQEKAHLEGMLEQIHQQFIEVVKQGRGERLADDERLFSGLFWSGEEAVSLGLVDELASPSQVARDVIGTDNVVDFTHKRSVLQRFAERLGASLARHIDAQLLQPSLK